MPRWWQAQAKLNLYLHVVGRRADGFHLLDSLVGFADIGDRIAVAPAAHLSLSVEGRFAADLASDDPGNLVWRAAETLARRLARSPDVALTLEKNLPVASGIGGGSSDAAATLKALIDLWQAKLELSELNDIAASLGADVPVCLGAQSAWMGGIGEQVETAPVLPRAPLVLVNPCVALPTPAVFKARRGPFSLPARFTEAPADAAALATQIAARRNDLTEPAIATLPIVAQVLERLNAQDNTLIARMSGSGATCFALFPTSTAAAAAAARLQADAPDWWVAAGHLV